MRSLVRNTLACDLERRGGDEIGANKRGEKQNREEGSSFVFIS